MLQAIQTLNVRVNELEKELKEFKK